MQDRPPSQKLGDLASQILSSQTASGSKASKELSRNLSTIGSVAETKEPTGVRYFGSGVARLPGNLPAAMATLDPQLVNNALVASLPQQVQSSLEQRLDPHYNLAGWTWAKNSQIELWMAQDSLILIRHTLAPAEPKKILAEVTRCLTVTKTRERDDQDQQALLSIFVEELSRFPGDIVAQALRNWARNNPWWPALADIVAQCDHMVRPRLDLLFMMSRVIKEANDANRGSASKTT